MIDVESIRDSLIELDDDTDDCSAFHVLSLPPPRSVRQKLIVLVHPGDMIELDFDLEALDRQAGLAAELRARDDHDLVILHRSSCSQFHHECNDIVEPALNELIEEGWKRGAILHGDDLEAAAAWILKNLAVEAREVIFMGGAYGDAEHGCLTFIGKAIAGAAPGRIALSEHIPSPSGVAWKTDADGGPTPN